jgi:Domain of unknown function (DUF4188)
MAKVIDKRMSAQLEGEFVVFLIGIRINKPWKLHKWLPVLLAMPKMLKELEAHLESGLLGHSGLGRIIVQYWRSFEHLEAYARAKDKKHWPALSISTAASATAAVMSESGMRLTS